MASPPRALRIGVLLGGNLVEEKVFTGHAAITFGQSMRCSLSIPGDGIPAEHLLFARDQGRTLLRLTASMDGRIAHGATVRTELRTGAGEHGVWAVPIERGARGKLQIGDATVLFQELAAPPLVPRPRLPASIRGTLGDRIDRRLAVIIGGSLVAHLAIAGYAWINDTETAPLLGSQLATYHQETMEVTLPELVQPVAPDQGPGTAVPVAPVQTPAPIVRHPTQVHTAAPDPSRMLEDAERMAQILTGSEPGRDGPGEMTARHPGADLDKQLADIRDGHRHVTIGTTTDRFRDQPGHHIGDGTHRISDDPNAFTELPGHRAEDPPGRIFVKPLPPVGPGTTLTVESVLERITSVYMPGLQRCYKKGLLREATLTGKVTIAFTVDERGHVTDGTASGVTPEVDACVGALMTGWHFGIPKDKTGEPTDAGFKLALALQPS